MPTTSMPPPTAPTRKRKTYDSHSPVEVAPPKEPQATAPTPRCLHITSTPPQPMPYKLIGETVFGHEFTAVHPDGATEQLWVVPATDSLPCGRGMLAHIDGLGDALLEKHGVATLTELRELERRWAERNAQSHWALEQYRARRAEAELERRLMTRDELATHDFKQSAIIAHYDAQLCRWRAGGLPSMRYTDKQFTDAGAKPGDVFFARLGPAHDLEELHVKYGPVIRKEACSTDLKRWVGRLKALGRPQRKPLLAIFVACGKTTKELVANMSQEETDGLMERVRGMQPPLPPHERVDFANELSRLQSKGTNIKRYCTNLF